MIPREIFGLETEAVRGYWRKLHRKKLYDFYSAQVLRCSSPTQ